VERVDLVVPVKRLAAAKSRLRGAADGLATNGIGVGAGGTGDLTPHTRLALALTLDTVAAARAASRVRTVLVVTADRTVTAALTASGIEVVGDPLVGLNAAYERGADVLRERDPTVAVGALQADLPALRPAELDEAVAAALAVGGRAFTADAEGTGTTFLLAAAGVALEPRFGGGSAARHAVSGAVALDGEWPSLRRDVDTPTDLATARRLGVGEHTRAALLPRLADQEPQSSPG
jgi:2-phospho-L-lactate/phosphoenolpyruvate guanylyltransferase